MSPREYLGGFELVVLLALARVRDNAYGASIHREILESTGRDVAIPAVYVTLRRLENKGFVSSSIGSSEESGDRATRNYTILPAGFDALQRTRETLESLWDLASCRSRS